MQEPARRNGPNPTREAVLHEADRELLGVDLLTEARLHARRLCGLEPYCHAQVLPSESARVIYSLLATIAEMEQGRTMKARRELEAENIRITLLLERQRREFHKWELHCPGQAELPFGA